ncbi:hypothetical protein [Scytonema sp. NUACC26]|uniref:hypothetical protein n=1 Tax=Scytonema sp. NUACC26 TaxID=3140176 RepID=UPI0034DBB8C1
MNTQLVESLVKIIQALTPEEQSLLNEKLQHQQLWQKEQQLEQIKNKISERRKGKPFSPTLEEYIHITREERNMEQDELLKACFRGES